MKKHFFARMFIVGSILSMFACQSENTLDAKLTKKRYFDIKGYFAKQIDQYTKQKNKLTKTVFLNNRQETKILDNINWQDEFALFTNSDINKIAWNDSYSVDSTLQQHKKHLHYKTLDADLRTQEIEVWFDNTTQQLDSLYIRNKVKNVFYSLDEKLYFSPQKGYYINTLQKTTFMQPALMQIKGNFVAL